jgi:outer membrane immunogenic protein
VKNSLKLTTAVLALALGGGAAMAADLPAPEVPMIAAAPVVWSWTGPYAGLFIGGGFDGDIDGHHNKKSDDDLNGVFGGGYVGYNWQMDSFLLGVETDAGFTGWETDGGGKKNKFKGDVGVIGSVRGRVGFAWDRLLLFGTGGFGYADLNVNNAGKNKHNKNDGDFLTGWVAGGGVEFAVTDNVLVKLEYLYYDVGEEWDGKNKKNNNKKDGQFAINTVKLGVAYKF